MRKLLFAVALFAVPMVVVETPAQAYPWGWEWSNAATCNMHRNIGRLFGMGAEAMDNCFGSFYGK